MLRMYSKSENMIDLTDISTYFYSYNNNYDFNLYYFLN